MPAGFQGRHGKGLKESRERERERENRREEREREKERKSERNKEKEGKNSEKNNLCYSSVCRRLAEGAAGKNNHSISLSFDGKSA